MNEVVKQWVPVFVTPGEDYLYSIDSNGRFKDYLVDSVVISRNNIMYYSSDNKDTSKCICYSKHINTGVKVNGKYYFTSKKLRREHMKKMEYFSN